MKDYDSWTDSYTLDEGIALHHGGGSDYRAGNPPFSRAQEMAQLRSWERWHVEGRGWGGLGYGWALGQTGAVYRGRGWNSYGAHLGDIDGDGISNNQEILPVVFIGSGNHHTLSTGAQDSFVRLRRYFEETLSRELFLWGHQEIQDKATSCPGPNLMTYIRNNRNLEDELTPEQEQALNWLVEKLASTSLDEPNWGKAAWSDYLNDWTAPPGPERPVTHLQLAHIKKKIEALIPNVPETIQDDEARSILKKIKEVITL